MSQIELQEMIADTLSFLQHHEHQLDSSEQQAMNELLDDLDREYHLNAPHELGS